MTDQKPNKEPKPLDKKTFEDILINMIGKNALIARSKAPAQIAQQAEEFIMRLVSPFADRALDG